MKKHLLPYIVLFVLALGLIFFWGKDGFTTQGYKDFSQSMDIAGGIKLTYNVDFERYDQLYNGLELESVKTQIMGIIIKNLTDRVSEMDSGEYSVYATKMNNRDYVVVEIGGITDLEQAKEDIGKTVELEFALRNNEAATAEQIQERQSYANDVYSRLSQSFEQGMSFSGVIESDSVNDMYVQIFDDVDGTELPAFFRDTVDLDTYEIGKLSSIYRGAYNQSFTLVGQSFQPVTESGFVFFVLRDRQQQERTSLEPRQFMNVVADASTTYTTEYVADTSLSPNAFAMVDGVINFNNGEVLPASAGVYAEIYSVSSGADVVALQETYNETKEVVGADELVSSWMTFDQVLNYVAGAQDQDGLQIVDQNGQTYAVVISERKAETDVLYDIKIVEGDAQTQQMVYGGLSQQTLYSVDVVFVNEKQTWMSARDPETGAILNGAYFDYASVGQSSVGTYVPQISFNTEGTAIFCRLTRANVGQDMAIFVDDVLVTNPTIQEEICGGVAVINGSYSLQEANQLVDDLNSGTLPAPLILAFEEKVSPLLGQHALQGALWASVIGIILIVVFLSVIYGPLKALITTVIMVVFLVYLLGLIKLFSAPISLSGIAAILLSLGMAVDANILIFERIREELKKGVSMRQAINTGYERSRPPIIDGNVSTALIALVLVFFDINYFSAFGLMILLTIALVLLINVPLTKIILHAFFRRKKDY